MRTALRFLALLLVLAANLSAQETSPRLRLVFWNVEWFPGSHPNATNAEAVEQITKVVPAIKALNPDILGLNEVLNWNAAAIATLGIPQLKVQVCSDFLDENGAKTFQQLVIASRKSAIGGWWEPWKTGKTTTPRRGFAFAAFQPAPGQILLVYCVHLKSNRGSANENIPMREESALQLIEHAAAMEKAYGPLGHVSTVIGGDFNTSTDDPKFKKEKTLKILEDAGFAWSWAQVPFAERVTLPSQPSNNPDFPPFPDACFDHVLVKGATIASVKVENLQPAPSDHRPVIVELQLP